MKDKFTQWLYDVHAFKIPVKEFEQFVYENEDFLTEKYGAEVYFELIDYDYRQYDAQSKMHDFVWEKMIDQDLYYKHRILDMVVPFIELERGFRNGLIIFDAQYKCRVDFYKKLSQGLQYLQEEERFRYSLKQQGNPQPKIDYERFHHEQMLPIAKKILEGLETENIIMLAATGYQISDEYREELEEEDFSVGCFSY